MIIITAEEFLEDFDYENQELGTDINYPMIERCMVEFAKLHVAAALNEAANEADVTVIDVDMTGVIWGVDVNTILNAYPLTKIK
jgi:NifB/MoaA-like Fe-S oxidoreductase